MSSIGTFFGICLAIAHKYLKVEEDPRLDIVEEMLPGTNCGACGEPGCRAFSEAIVGGVKEPCQCTVGSPDDIALIAGFLGVDAGEQDKLVARLHCAGGLGLARQIAEYEGYSNCRAAHLVGGAGKSCSWGCLGLDDCMISCDFDAIHMNDQRLPVVSVENCTALLVMIALRRARATCLTSCQFHRNSLCNALLHLKGTTRTQFVLFVAMDVSVALLIVMGKFQCTITCQ